MSQICKNLEGITRIFGNQSMTYITKLQIINSLEVIKGCKNLA